MKPTKSQKPGISKKAPVTAREVALDALVRIDREHAYSNLLLNQMLQQHSLSPADTRLVTELVYGTVQRRNTLDYWISSLLSKGGNKLEPWVKNLLRLSFYQLAYLDRIPDHAVVSEAVTIAGRRGHKGISGLVNAVLRNALRKQDALSIPDDLPPVKAISLKHAHPEWLVQRWIDQLGEATTQAMCEANNRQPHTSIRVNPLRLSRDQLLTALQEQGYEALPSELSPSGIVVRGGGNLAHASGYERGDYTIQDESSMLVAELLSVKPGMTVLDCCAAPGGKTTHIAEQMADSGILYAFDIHAHKQKLIDQQAERLGLRSIRTDVLDARRLGERFAPGSFDRILLDSPCSGLGVIRRKPDVKWTKSEADIAAISKLQDQLLRTVAPLLKPGGILVYSTCTVESEENEQAIARFLSEHPEFEPDSAAGAHLPQLERSYLQPGIVRILPHDYGTDGFFIAALRKQAF